MDPDELKSEIAVAIVPGSQVRQGAEAVDSGEIPDIDHDHSAAQVGHGERCQGINPGGLWELGGSNDWAGEIHGMNCSRK
jgi:hypothetical protein